MFPDFQSEKYFLPSAEKYFQTCGEILGCVCREILVAAWGEIFVCLPAPFSSTTGCLPASLGLPLLTTNPQFLRRPAPHHNFSSLHFHSISHHLKVRIERPQMPLIPHPHSNSGSILMKNYSSIQFNDQSPSSYHGLRTILTMDILREKNAFQCICPGHFLICPVAIFRCCS